MKKISNALLLLTLLVTNLAFAGKLQNGDFKTEAELITAGTTKAKLLNDTKIYVTANGINDRLDTAIASGLIGGNCSSLLSNGCFETGTGSWTNVAGTFTATTTSGEFTEGSKAAKVALSSQVLNLSQTVTTPSGIQKQGVIGAAYKVPSAITDFQICSLVDAVEQTCVPSASLIADGTFHSIEIPITFGSTSAGIKFKTTASYTQNVFFDSTYLNQGLGFQNLMLDNTYSFRGSSAGVVSLENKDFVSGNGSISATSVYTYTFVSGTFSAAPNCTCITDRTAIGSNAICAVDSSSATQVVVEVKIPGTGASAQGHQVICQKSGNDYLTASASVYSQASANFSGVNEGVISIGAVTTGPTKGTIVTDRWISARFGNRLVSDAQYDQTAAGGDGGSGDYLITLPGGRSFDSNHVFFYTGNLETGAVGTPAKSVVGTGTFYSGTSGSYHGVVSLIAYDATRFRVLLLYGNGNDSAINNTSWDSGGVFSLANIVGINLHIDAPISGWTNASSIVGSFSGVPTVPGQSGNVDTFSVSYGTTNATTVCSASPCSFIDQIGTAVNATTGITRVSLGTIRLTTIKTYLKLKCLVSAAEASGSVSLYSGTSLSCSNCSQVTFDLANTSVLKDSFGTFMCQGSY